MKTRVPDYYKEFKCIADKCEDTCCAGWEIVIDDETYEKYEKVEGNFGLRLKNEIIEDEGEHIFVLKGNDCAFLNKNKMCDIYSELGEDALCYTCQQYPRYTEEYGSIREVGLSLSCPEAARIILNDSKRVEFVLSEDDGMVTDYNDINYDMFMQIISSRKIVFDILQDRSMPLENRIAVILKFAQDIQQKIDDNCIEEISEIRNEYENNEFIKKYIDEIKEFRDNGEKKYNNIIKYFKEYQQLDHINEKWPKVLEESINYFNKKESYKEYLKEHQEFNNYHSANEFEYEQLIVYFIFRYFMKAIFDYDVSAKIKLAIISMLMIKELSIVRWIEKGNFIEEDLVDIAHMYSKDVEHSDENIEALQEVFETRDIFDSDEIIATILN